MTIFRTITISDLNPDQSYDMIRDPDEQFGLVRIRILNTDYNSEGGHQPVCDNRYQKKKPHAKNFAQKSNV
jgi:hypothetical protein